MSRRFSQRSALVLGAGLALATLPATASAALVGSTVLGPRSAALTSVDAAAAPDGSAIVGYRLSGSIWVALKQPGALVPPATNLGPVTFGLATAAAADGRGAVAWITGSDRNANTTLHIALRAPGSSTLTELPTTAVPGAESVDAAFGSDGRLFVGWAATASATLVTVAPGAGQVITVKSVSGPGITGTAVGTQGTTGWLLATRKSSNYSEAMSGSWSPTTGQGETIRLDSQVDSSATPSSVETYAPDHPQVRSGDVASFLWRRKDTDRSGIATTYPLVRITAPFTDSAPSTEIAHGYNVTGNINTLSDASIATDRSGAGLIGWSSAATADGEATGAGVSVVRVDAAGRFGPVLTVPPGPTGTERITGLTTFALAPAGGGSAQAYYSYGGALLSSRIAADGSVPGAGPSSLPFAAGDQTTAAIAPAGTGTGDSLAAWGVTGSAGKVGVQVVLDDATPPALTVAPAAPTADTFDADASDVWTPATVTWDFGDGTTATGAHVQHRYATYGTFRVKATATDAAGNATTQAFDRVNPIPPGEPGGPGAAGGGGSTQPLTLSGLTLSSTSFKVAKKVVSKTKGTQVGFTLSAAAKVRLAVTQKAKGWKAGKSACGKKKPKTGKAKRCTYPKLVASTTIDGRAGLNTYAFTGKLGSRTLKAGKYTLVATTDLVGDPGGPSKTFTVKRG